MSRPGTWNRSQTDKFCSRATPTMYPKFRGLWYLVDREFRTSRRPLNVASVRAGLSEQATKYQSSATAGQSMPRPRDDEIKKEQHGRQAANTSNDLGIRDLGPRHGRPQFIAHRRRPAVRTGCRQPAGRSHHQGQLWPVELLCPYLPRPRHRPRARRGYLGARYRRREHQAGL